MLKLRCSVAPLIHAGSIPLLALFFLPACGGQKHRESNLLFKDWYVVKPLAAGSGSVAYGTIKNEGATPVRLKKTEFACAAAADLHETLTEADRVRMAPLPQTSIAPGETLVFEPGHKHVMLQNIKMPTDEKCYAVFAFDSVMARFAIPIRERKK